MPRSNKLDSAIASAAQKGKSREPRKVKPVSKRGRKQSDTSATSTTSARVWSPTELAAEIGYSRDAIYKWEGQGLERTICGKGFTMAAVLAFIGGRERAAGRAEADPDDALQAELLRDKRAVADMREDERDLKRRKLIEADLVIAIYQDDSAHVSAHLRGMGARLMQTLAVEDDPTEICRIVDDDVEQALSNLSAAHVDPESDDRHPYLGGANLDGRA